MTMSILPFILYALIGVFAGFSGGLLGIGGGLVAVPGLFLIFQWQSFPESLMMQQAIGTSLAAMFFTAASSAIAHSLKKGVNWHLFRLLAPGVIVGSVFGALIADRLPSRELMFIFGISECLIGAYFLIPQLNRDKESSSTTPRTVIFLILGILIGSISTILGIGGGVITVPVLTAFRTPLKNAISTSAATGFLIALIGAASFFLLGLRQPVLNGSAGYIYLPAFIAIGITSSLFAPLGAKLAYALPSERLKHVFGIFLLIVGISMLFKYIH